MSPDLLRQYLEFYRDLGIPFVYEGRVAPPGPPPQEAVPPIAATQPELEMPRPLPTPSGLHSDQDQPGLLPPDTLFSLLPEVPSDDTLTRIRADIGDCTRCRLCEGRNKIVFGAGNESARLVFVGEGPGADEDASGIPFVGRAGQLLTQMIENTAAKEGIPIKRDDVYIANVVKCRPPENRTPEPDEMDTCGQFLHRQLAVIKPKAIVALGGTAARSLLNRKEGVTKLRGQFHPWRDIPVMVTWHPSYLLRPYNKDAKREAWEDLKKVLHFVYG